MTERALRPPLSGERDTPFSAIGGSDGLTLDGFAAVFNRPTTIDSFEGRFREQTCPGSMVRSFRDIKPKIQFEHGRSQIWGALPIATLERAAEEIHPELAPEGGAHVVARMSPLPLFEPLRWAISEGAVDGMSFRFTVLREAWNRHDGEPIPDTEVVWELERTYNGPEDELPLRSLKEVRVLELGPVVWPAYKETSVTMRSQTVIDLGALRTNPEQRTILFRALLGMADSAQQPAAEAAGERPETSSDDAQQGAAEEAAAERPSKPSMKRGSRGIDLALRNMRDTLISLERHDDGRIDYPRNPGRAAFRPDADAPAGRKPAARDSRPDGGPVRTGRPHTGRGSRIPVFDGRIPRG